MFKYLLGAATTLVIGILVVVISKAITREKEHLIYTIDQPVAFETDTTHFTILNIGIANVGDSPAKGVEIVIDASHSGTQIKDQSVVSSSGPASGIVVNGHLPKDVSISLNSLIPKEQIKVSLLLTSKPKEMPIVSVKSDASLGTLESSLSDTERRSEKFFTETLRISVVAMALVTVIIGLYPLIRKRRPQRLSDAQPPR
jgi:hypothetical protein